MISPEIRARLRRPLVEPPAGLEQLRTRLLLLGFWVVLGALETAKEFTAGRLLPTPRPLGDAILINFPYWFLWAFGALIVVGLARRWPLDRGSVTPAVLRHLAVSLLIAALHLTLVALIVYFAVARGTNLAGSVLRVQIRFWIEAYVIMDAFVYWMVLGTFHALLYQNRYVRGALREAEARTRALRFEKAAVAARLQALQMELNPHFLFNSLNAVSGLVDEGRNSEATTVIARLAQLLRMTLHRGQERAIELDLEIEYVQLYLDMEQVRFGPRLHFDIAVEDAVRSALVPPMILQPLVENAVRHGISRVTGDAGIRITARRSGDMLQLTVEDDGPGPTASTGDAHRAGRGLANVRERLDALYGSGADLTIGPGAEGAGARADVRLPLNVRGADRPALAGAR